MTNTKQELIAIRDGAPSGATHYKWFEDEIVVYLRSRKNEFMVTSWNGCWRFLDIHEMPEYTWLFYCEGVKSLDDITAQIELFEQNEKLKAEVKELRKSNSHAALRAMYQKSQAEVKELRHQLDMSVITVETKTRLLDSCEIALVERDENNEKLEARVAELVDDFRSASNAFNESEANQMQFRKRITELERERQEILKRLCDTEAKLASVALTGSPFGEEALANFALEQQAKGLQFALENISNPDVIYAKAEQLRNSAKGDSDE